VLFLYDFDFIGGNCEQHKDPTDINNDEEVKVDLFPNVLFVLKSRTSRLSMLLGTGQEFLSFYHLDGDIWEIPPEQVNSHIPFLNCLCSTQISINVTWGKAATVRVPD
jgi:hypothetical protein